MSSRAPESSRIALAVALATALPFLPALGNGFVNWDDYQAVRDNPMLARLSWDGLRWMLTTFHLGHFQPLAWLSLGLDRLLWGLSPGGVHATALAWHCLSAALYFLLARDLLALARPQDGERARLAAAALAALAFSVHPLRVESVAWATERRDVLCEAFSLGALLAYVRGRRLLTLCLFFLALCSKVFAAVLPAVMLALDFYPLRRRAFSEKLPLFALSALALAAGLAAQASTPALLDLSQFGLLSRLSQAAYAVAFYPAKTLFPVGLSAWYGDAFEAPPVQAAAGAAFFLLVSGACWRARRSAPAAAAAWAAYLIWLLPASGLVKSAAQLVADRYSYLSCLPFPVLAAGAALALPSRRRAQAAGLCSVLLFALGAATWRQTLTWRDSVSLWTRACAMNPQSPFPRTSLIFARLERDEPDLALQELGRLRRVPSADGSSYEGLAARVLNNAGVQLAQRGRLDEAEAALSRALELEPGLAEAERNLAAARAARRKARR